jgi:hypothetical protein
MKLSIFWNILEYSICQNGILKSKWLFGTDLMNLLFNYGSDKCVHQSFQKLNLYDKD